MAMTMDDFDWAVKQYQQMQIEELIDPDRPYFPVADPDLQHIQALIEAGNYSQEDVFG